MPNAPRLKLAFMQGCGCHENGVEFFPEHFSVLRGTYNPVTHMLSPGGVLTVDPIHIPPHFRPYRIAGKTCGQQYFTGRIGETDYSNLLTNVWGTEPLTWTPSSTSGMVNVMHGTTKIGEIPGSGTGSYNYVWNLIDGGMNYFLNASAPQYVLPLSFSAAPPALRNDSGYPTCVEKIIVIPYHSWQNPLQRINTTPYMYHIGENATRHISEAEREVIRVRVSGFSGFACTTLNRDFLLTRKPYGNDGILLFSEYVSAEFTWTETVTMKTAGADANGVIPVSLPGELCSYYGQIVDVDVELTFRARMTATTPGRTNHIGPEFAGINLSLYVTMDTVTYRLATTSGLPAVNNNPSGGFPPGLETVLNCFRNEPPWRYPESVVGENIVPPVFRLGVVIVSSPKYSANSVTGTPKPLLEDKLGLRVGSVGPVNLYQDGTLLPGDPHYMTNSQYNLGYVNCSHSERYSTNNSCSRIVFPATLRTNQISQGFDNSSPTVQIVCPTLPLKPTNVVVHGFDPATFRVVMQWTKPIATNRTAVFMLKPYSPSQPVTLDPQTVFEPGVCEAAFRMPNYWFPSTSSTYTATDFGLAEYDGVDFSEYVPVTMKSVFCTRFDLTRTSANSVDIDCILRIPGAVVTRVWLERVGKSGFVYDGPSGTFSVSDSGLTGNNPEYRMTINFTTGKSIIVQLLELVP